MASIDSSLAESMKAHVLTTSTSASSESEVIYMPCCKTLPSMISASTRFFAQPRLIMPTFGLPATKEGPVAWTFTTISEEVAEWERRAVRDLSREGEAAAIFASRVRQSASAWALPADGPVRLGALLVLHR